MAAQYIANTESNFLGSENFPARNSTHFGILALRGVLDPCIEWHVVVLWLGDEALNLLDTKSLHLAVQAKCPGADVECGEHLGDSVVPLRLSTPG